MHQELIEWAKEKGLKLSEGIEFKTAGDDNTGAFLSDNATENPSIRLPLDLAITIDSAVNDFGTDLLPLKDTSGSSNKLLKLLLARERSRVSQSTIKPYLQTLPTLQQMKTPYCWDAETKKYLKGTNLGSSLKQNVRTLIEEWWSLITLLPENIQKPEQHYVNMKYYYEAKFYSNDDTYAYFVTNEDPENWTSFPNYLWASIILKSRSFPAYLIADSVTWKVLRDDAMLLPVVDLLNHLPSSHVEWGVEKEDGKNFFVFKADEVNPGAQLYNNYGMKGNEELLLAYGFCLENNVSDVAALKIKIPETLVSEIKKFDIRLPKLEDHTNSVVEDVSETTENETDEGLYFLKKDMVPPDLIRLFQVLVKNQWESDISLRMKFTGLNQLRNAIEAKVAAHTPDKVPHTDDEVYHNIKIYVQSQKEILSSCVKHLKHIEKDMLSDAEIKPQLTSLKTVYKNDLKFQQSLLVTLGVTSYDVLLQNELQDQCWLLWLMRCHNRNEYIKLESDNEDNYLPEWVYQVFVKLRKSTKVSAAEVVQYQELYQGLIIPLSEQVPEIYGTGSWLVEDMVVSAKLLDLISFCRGKNQECILVETHI